MRYIYKIHVGIYENVLENIRSQDVKFPTKYALIGIVLSDSEYYYKYKGSSTGFIAKRVSILLIILLWITKLMNLILWPYSKIFCNILRLEPNQCVQYASVDILDNSFSLDNNKLHDFFTSDNTEYSKQLAEAESQEKIGIWVIAKI